MKLVEEFKVLSKKKKIIYVSTVLAIIAACVLVCVVRMQGYYATTMRLLKIEGTVTIEDADGNEKPVIDNIRFSSGEALSTGSDGLASVGLDDTKIVTLESDSRVEFTKARNMLELNLTQGGIYFEVTEHLADEETFDIRTSTMTVGIRGTSGYVFYDDDGREALVITDGCVHVVAVNPETGEVRETDVHGGYSVKVYLYDESREEGSIEFFLEELEEDEIPGFALRMLAENEELLNRVCDYTGWSQEEILALVDDIQNGTYEPEETEETTETSETDPSSDGDEDLTPTPTNSPTPTPSTSPTPTPRATATPTPTPIGMPSGTPTVSPSPTATPSPVPGGSSSGSDDDATPPTDPTTSPSPAVEPSESEETDPGETEPEVTEPEVTEPEETEPGETEPGETEPGETEPLYTDPVVPEEYEDYDTIVWQGPSEAYEDGCYVISVDGGYLGYVEGDGWVPLYYDNRHYVHGELYGYLEAYFLSPDSDSESTYDDAYYMIAMSG